VSRWPRSNPQVSDRLRGGINTLQEDIKVFIMLQCKDQI
jgi:hypothetical protein